MKASTLFLLACTAATMVAAHPSSLECGTDATTRLRVGEKIMMSSVADAVAPFGATVAVSGAKVTVTANAGVFFAVRAVGAGASLTLSAADTALAATTNCTSQIFYNGTGAAAGSWTLTHSKATSIVVGYASGPGVVSLVTVKVTPAAATESLLTLTEIPDLDVSALLDAAAAANATHYGDPASGCESDEVSIKITGVKGDACVPKCTTTACPTDKPAGVTATPQCALKSSTGDKYCALICSPAAEALSFPAFKKAADAQCGTNASCKAIQTVGICTYDD